MESFAALSQALTKKQKKFGQASILSEINQLPSKKSQTYISALAKALTHHKILLKTFEGTYSFLSSNLPIDFENGGGTGCAWEGVDHNVIPWVTSACYFLLKLYDQ